MKITITVSFEDCPTMRPVELSDDVYSDQESLSAIAGLRASELTQRLLDKIGYSE